MILQKYSEDSFGRVNSAVVALSTLVNYLSTSLSADIEKMGKSASLVMLTKQLELWNKSLRKFKTQNNARLRVSFTEVRGTQHLYNSAILLVFVDRINWTIILRQSQR